MAVLATLCIALFGVLCTTTTAYPLADRGFYQNTPPMDEYDMGTHLEDDNAMEVNTQFADWNEDEDADVPAEEEAVIYQEPPESDNEASVSYRMPGKYLYCRKGRCYLCNLGRCAPMQSMSEIESFSDLPQDSPETEDDMDAIVAGKTKYKCKGKGRAKRCYICHTIYGNRVCANVRVKLPRWWPGK